MSPSDLLKETGLKLSNRQFRRYLAANAFDGILKGKRGHYYVVGPVTPQRIENIKNSIAALKRTAGRPRRPRNRSRKSDRSGGIATIEGLRGFFDIWGRRIGEGWKAWPAEKQVRLFEEIRPIYEMGMWLKTNQPLLKFEDAETKANWLRQGVEG